MIAKVNLRFEEKTWTNLFPVIKNRPTKTSLWVQLGENFVNFAVEAKEGKVNRKGVYVPPEDKQPKKKQMGRLARRSHVCYTSMRKPARRKRKPSITLKGMGKRKKLFTPQILNPMKKRSHKKKLMKSKT